ncbi:MAG: MurR/RpiR family transcriptional regulator [Thomasclavelia sp.]|nr:MurR/RpiR family transcriptional regulator [Thomasclavelia sp.]
MESIFDRIQKQNKLNENEKIILDYIVNHLDEIPYISSRELARRTYTSSTVIIRFIKKLNYESYNDFKLNIVADLKHMNAPDLSILSNEDILSLVNKTSDIEIQIIERTKENLSMNKLKDIASLLVKYQYIDIIANDTNATIAQYASHLLWSLGKIVNVYDKSDKQLFVGINIPQDHLVILISKYGRNDILKKTALTLKSRGVKTIGLTSQFDKQLFKLCDYHINGFVEESSEKLRDTVFYISLKYILDLFYVILFSQNYDNAIQLEDLYSNIFNKKM